MIHKILVVALFGSILGLGSTIPAVAQESAPSDSDFVTFVLGNFEFLILHELAHMLIGEKNIPIIGPEENAADYIAVTLLIRAGKVDPDQQPVLRQFVASAAEAFSISWELGRQYGIEIPYWDAHALGIQRYYAIVCLLYGSDPAEFGDLLAEAELPEARSRSCESEYAKADQSLQWLLDTFGRGPSDPESAPVQINYEQPRSRMQQAIVEAIQSRQMLEQTVEAIRQRFLIESPFKVEIRACGQPQGAWLPAERALVVCYELLDAFAQFESMRR